MTESTAGHYARSRAAPARLLALCASTLLAVTPACDRSPPDAGDAQTPPAARNSGGAASTQPAAADASDDPAAPVCFPRSHEVGSWVKIEPVRVSAISADTQPTTAPADADRRMLSFRLNRRARSTYADNAGRRVEVQMIEAATAADAFGLFSTHAEGERLDKLGGRAVVHRDAPATLLWVWQGTACLRFACAGLSESIDEVRPLAMRVVGMLPAEDVPELATIFPSEEAADAGPWLVRSLTALSPDDAARLNVPDPAAADKLLSLDGEAWLCIRAYDAPGVAGWNVVWTAAYADETAARSAYEHIVANVGRTWDHVSVLPAQNRYVIGTFTIERESQMHIMPRLALRLPR